MVKRSRELWDDARRPGAPWTAFLRAILYELQPVRFSSIDVSALRSTARRLGLTIMWLLLEGLPSLARGTYGMLRNLSRRQWAWIVGVISYYYGVRYIHRVLDLGPIVVISTALVVIFTVGLDDSGATNGVSAYSVFNRGFERLLGSVDVESLVAQHVGGAMGMAGVGLGAGAMDRAHPPEPEEPVLGVARLPVEQRDMQGDNNEGEAQNNNRNRSRKSGKKARRGNLEQRREMQRQRQAAQAMGFAGDGGADERIAMQRLLEEQIAAANNDF